jgi:hypothetical protein
MYPMKDYPIPDFKHSGPSQVYQVHKFGTFVDFILQFKRPADQTWVVIILGVIDAKELGFVARECDPASAHQDYNFSNSGSSKNPTTATKLFANSALPIGSVVDVEALHRVSIRQLLTDSKGSSDADGQVMKLEIDITALDQAIPVPNQAVPVLNQAIPVQSEVHSKRSCCRVQ